MNRQFVQEECHYMCSGTKFVLMQGSKIKIKIDIY